MTELVVEVTRGPLVESFHRVAACALDRAGNVLYASGEIDVPVYLRSSAKPFIAAAIVEAGAAREFGFDQREIATIAASHSGEPMHVDAVRSILRKIGAEASALQCGAHYPYDEASAAALARSGEPPSVLHNNCSGKHAGIVALCKVIGADSNSYLLPENPAQRRILEFCARMCGDDAATWIVGTDGCGIPVYATSLRNAARSFVRLATLADVNDADAQALRVVRDAMIAYPQYVAGTGQLDTELMAAGGGNVVAKAGAEGVHAAGAIRQGYGFAAKVLDGGGRARGPSTIAVLRSLGVLNAEQSSALERFARPAIRNRAGAIVGEIRAVL